MNKPIRHLVDEHRATAVATGRRKRGIDGVSLADADLLDAEGDHPGVAYAPQGRSMGELVRLLDLLTQVSDAGEMRGRIEYI